MSTLRNLLVNNPRVKEILQMRKTLGEAFPYTDWTKVPVKHYSKFLSLKDLIGECGVIWTNAFHRSNIEAETTRKHLKDYSGNERDIELFNFEWSGTSGYGVGDKIQDFTKWYANTDTSVQNDSTYTMIVENPTTSTRYSVLCDRKNLVNKKFIVYIEPLTQGASCSINYIKSNWENLHWYHLNEGLNVIEPYNGDFDKVCFSTTAHSQVRITEINPTGAIISDGVNDYGQCVKDFSLPDDYTVVAMREMLTPNSCLVSKIMDAQNGAFCMELFGNSTISYGTVNDNSVPPKLFSFQTRESYNGSSINSGDSGDSNTNKLILFKRPLDTPCSNIALYSFGIFNKTLTAEELALVEDCMYLELEYNTNILDGIEYYDILDARYRSNEEAEDKRNKWNGRLGKLHLTLNNYDYTDLSGWNCHSLPAFNLYNYISLTNITEFKAKITKVDGNGWLVYMGVPSNLKKYGLKIKIHKSTTKRVGLLFLSDENSTVANITLEEGLNTISSTSIPEEFANVCFDLNSFSIGEYIEVEQLPLYPGALVSDRVDDHAVSDEVIDEEIGGIVMQAEEVSKPSTFYGNIFSSTVGLGGESGKEIAGLVSKADDKIILGDPWTTLDKDAENIYGLSRVPISPDNKLMIGNNKSNEWGNAALYQLRLIKNQPTDLQLEVIKHQVLMEHNDYIKEMGWN